MVPHRPTAEATDGDFEDRPDAGEFIGPVAFEAAEVVRAEECLSRCVHSCHVEGDVVVPSVFFEERKRSWVIVDEVSVAFPFGLKAGMEGERDFLDFENDDVGRKIALQTESEAVGGKTGVGFEIGNLPCGVDTRIGPA